MNEIIPDIFLRGCRDIAHIKPNRMKEAFVPSKHVRPDGYYDISTNHHDKGNEAIRILARDKDNACGGVIYGKASNLLAPLQNIRVSSFGDKPHLPEISDKLLTDVIHFEDPDRDQILVVEGNPYHWSLLFSPLLTVNPERPESMNQALLRAIANKMVQGANLHVIDRDTLDLLLSDPEFDPHIEYMAK